MLENPALRKIALIGLLLLLEALFFGVEIWTGETVSLQSLFVIPIIISGLFLGKRGILFFSAFRRSSGWRPIAARGSMSPNSTMSPA